MKKYLGFISIIACMLITILFWSFSQPSKNIWIYREISQLVAALMLVGFTWINFISTRHRILDSLFNGLDKSYIYHKYLSIISVLLIFVHVELLGFGRPKNLSKPSGAPAGESVKRVISENSLNFSHYAKTFASLSMILFIIIIIIALIAKKLDYEKWKAIHKFMIIPYAFGVFHYYGNSEYPVFALTPFSLWLNVINIFGLACAVYSVFIYEKSAFKYRYKASKVEQVSKDILEITGTTSGKGMSFSAGQFAFFKLLGKENKFPSHPFTISEAPKNGEIQFTIKSLGDHTKTLLETIKVGDEFAVAGPHGEFNYKTGAKHQIWIAGGIGITPFRSFYQSDVPNDYSIDFFYAFNNLDEGSYLDELKSISKNNLKVHLYNAQEVGFLSAEEIAKHIKTDKSVDVYFCGPKIMRDKLKVQFKNSQVKVIDFHYEQFQFK